MSDGAAGGDRARIAELFDRVADLPPAEARRVLDAECADAPDVRREVIELLAFDPGRSAAPLAEASTRPDPGARRDPPPTADPSAIGRFRVTGRLGAGGMGVVYEGVDPTLGRAVALKLVLAGGGEDGKARLLREAQAMARVAHPNVVPVYEVGYHEEGVFVAMELVPGQTLGAWAKEAPRPWRDALRLLVQAGRGLAAAHDAGVLHRDFKLENVIVGSDGRARVLDFGLARAVDVPASPAEPADEARAPLDVALTAAGAIMGTPAYMSPEHFGGEVEPASDQWSYAVSAWRLLFGELPFRGNLLAIRSQVLEGPPPVPARADELPPAVVQAVRRGLARAPEERFPSVAAMVDALESVLLVDPEADASVSRSQRRRAAVPGFGVMLVAAIGLGIHFWREPRRDSGEGGGSSGSSQSGSGRRSG